MGTNLRDGNIDRMGVVALALNPGSVSANTSSEQSFTVPGVRVGDYVAVSAPSLTAGFMVSNARVSAADTVAIQFANITGSPIDVSSRTYTIIWFRPTPGATLPTAVQV